MVFEPFLRSYVIHKLDADPVTPRYYPIYDGYPRSHIALFGEYVIKPEEVDRTSCRLVSKKLPKDNPCEEDFSITSQIRDDQRVSLDNVVCYPSYLSDSDRFLLLGENDDEKMRLLIAPREGRALEIRPLSLSFNEANRRLEVEWEKRRALKDQEIGGIEMQNTVTEEN